MIISKNHYCTIQMNFNQLKFNYLTSVKTKSFVFVNSVLYPLEN